MSSSDLSPPPDDGDGSSSDGSSGTGSSGGGARAHRSDDDLPDDLTAQGSHRAHPPPNDTGRTVRSPTGPDPAQGSATVTPALFQVMEGAHDDTSGRIRIRTHPPRRVVEDADDGYREVAQARTPGDLRDALSDLPDRADHAVFEVHDDGEVYVEPDASLDHPWLAQPRYDVVTFFPSAEAAQEYTDGLPSR